MAKPVTPITIQEKIASLRDRVFRFALNLTKNNDKASDITQSTMLRALENADSFQEGTNLDSWLFRIAQNIWIDQVRSAANRTSVSMEDSEASGAQFPALASTSLTPQEGRMAWVEFERFTQLLSEDQRLIIQGIMQGKTYQQIADEQAVPIGTVMSRLSRAREVLSDAMGEPRRRASGDKSRTKKGSTAQADLFREDPENGGNEHS